MTNELQNKLENLPDSPGVYIFKNKQNKIIYIGKAKNLKNRVRSYFNKSDDNRQFFEYLLQHNETVDWLMTNTEQEALILENSLIKQFQPRFNIDLKDDKSFPFIIIKKEPFPRVFLTRRKINDGSEYLGPFTSVGKVRELLNFIKQNIPLRSCKLNLSQTNIEKKKFKICLEYHLGNCKGPCEGLQSLEEYDAGVDRLKNLMKGNLSPVFQHYKTEMQYYSEHLEFEKAEMIKKKLDHLQNYKAKSTIVNERIGTVDVFSILEEGDIAYVNYLAVNNGSIVLTKTITLKKKLDEPPAEVLAFAIAQMRATFNSEAKEIIIPFSIDYPQTEINITIPLAGDKKKLLELSEKNVNYFKVEMKKNKMLLLEDKTTLEIKGVLEQLQKDLQLSEIPTYIECFDNSNFQGSYPVSAMVCFKNGLPSKNDYRRFNVKTVKGINDFATMSEVVYRRYKRLSEEKMPFPQLVIIDGGKGQLSAAMESIKKLNLEGCTTLVGLAKNEEELFFYGDQQSIKLPWNSESLKLIRRIRDEVHRFGITFHRNQRSKGNLKNELEQIKGIGKSTIDTLLKKFKSIKNIKERTQKELEEIIGNSKASILKAHFNAADKPL